MNTSGYYEREMFGDDLKLFNTQTRQEAEDILKDCVKDVINGVIGVLTGDTVLDVVKENALKNFDEGLKQKPELELKDEDVDEEDEADTEVVTPGDNALVLSVAGLIPNLPAIIERTTDFDTWIAAEWFTPKSDPAQVTVPLDDGVGTLFLRVHQP